MSVRTGGLSVTSQDPSGDKRWTIVAGQAEAELTPDGAHGGLKDVRLTLYERDAEYLSVEGAEGWANSAAGEFQITGGVAANTPDGRSRFWASSVRGDRDVGVVRADGDVRAKVSDISIGGASTATAHFTGADSKSPSLTRLDVQGAEVWFESADKAIRITGVTTGETGYGPDGSTIDFKLVGEPVRFHWKEKGVTITARKLDAKLARMEGRDFRLISGEFSSGVRIDFAGSEGGSAWEITSSAPFGEYSGSSAEFSLTGGVEVRSSHPSLAGTFKSPSIVTAFDTELVAAGKGFKPTSVRATGPGTSFVSDDSRMTATGMTSLRFTATSTSGASRFDAKGAPVAFTAKSPNSGNIEVRASALEGEIRRTDSGESALYEADARNGIAAELDGRAGQTQTPWSLTGSAESMEYRRSESRMTLLGVREVVGKHPALPTGAGTLYAPRVDVVFYPGTFNPKSIRTSKVAL